MTQTKKESKTIQGIVITVTCFILSIVAKKAGIDFDFVAIQDTLTTSVAEITQIFGVLIGLFVTLKGRLNPEIKPIVRKKK